jgi:hypothetical protein
LYRGFLGLLVSLFSMVIPQTRRRGSAFPLAHLAQLQQHYQIMLQTNRLTSRKSPQMNDAKLIKVM